MLGISNTRFPRALRRLGQHKLETIALATVASVSAAGIARQGGPASTVSAVTATAITQLASSAPASSVTRLDRAGPADAASATAMTPTASAARSVDLPLISHPRVDSWIRRFTTDQRGSMTTYLSRMTRYEPMIASALAQRDMPQSLIYLAMIESGFNPQARSPVKASGLWQFMAATGQRFGLTVNRRVDERNDPAKATSAALAYLSYLHDRFGSWYLAAAAYNSGEGTVSKALKRVTGRTKGTDADFYRISPKLPRETRDYVPKLIAAARIGRNPARYGFDGD